MPATPPYSHFWGGLVRVDVVSAPASVRLSFVSAYTLRVATCAGGPDVATAMYAEEAGVSLTPPLSRESAQQLGGLQLARRVELQLRESTQAADISISGLGWVSVGALASLRGGDMSVVIDVWAPKEVQVSLRPPMPVQGLPNPPEACLELE